MLLYMRNPDRSSTADEPLFWTLGGGELHADVTVEPTDGYDGTAGWRSSDPAAYGIKYPRAVLDNRSFAVGIRVNLDSLPGVDTVVLAAVDDAGNMQCSASINDDGTMSIWRGTMDSELVRSEDALDTSTDYRVGFMGSVDHSGGDLEIYVNGEVFIRINNEDTAQETSNTWRGVYVGFHEDWVASHFYIVDGSGSQTGLIHGAYVKVFGPDANGTHTAWPPLGAASAYQAIDDTDPDADATRIVSPAIVGTRYTVSMSTLAATLAIYGAQLSAMARNLPSSGLGSPSHELVVMSGGNSFVDTWQSVVTEDWRVLTKVWDVDPETEEPWTVDGINAAEWGGQLQT